MSVIKSQNLNSINDLELTSEEISDLSTLFECFLTPTIFGVNINTCLIWIKGKNYDISFRLRQDFKEY